MPGNEPTSSDAGPQLSKSLVSLFNDRDENHSAALTEAPEDFTLLEMETATRARLLFLSRFPAASDRARRFFNWANLDHGKAGQRAIGPETVAN